VVPGLADFVTGFGIAVVIEGLLYALFPNRARSVWQMVASLPENTLRAIGIAAVATGVMVVWLVRG
jgi:uncharacterized protein